MSASLGNVCSAPLAGSVGAAMGVITGAFIAGITHARVCSNNMAYLALRCQQLFDVAMNTTIAPEANKVCYALIKDATTECTSATTTAVVATVGFASLLGLTFGAGMHFVYKITTERRSYNSIP